LVGARGAQCLLYGGVNVPRQWSGATYTHGRCSPGAGTCLLGAGEPPSSLAGCTGKDAEAAGDLSPTGVWCGGGFLVTEAPMSHTQEKWRSPLSPVSCMQAEAAG